MSAILKGITSLKGQDIGKEIALAIITAATVYFVTKKIKQWDEKRP